MNRRTFLKASVGAVGISTIGYYRDRIPIRFRDDLEREDVKIEDVSLGDDVQVMFTLHNLVEEPVDVSTILTLYDRGEEIRKFDWQTFSLEPEETIEIQDDVGDNMVWYADDVTVEVDSIKHGDRLI